MRSSLLQSLIARNSRAITNLEDSVRFLLYAKKTLTIPKNRISKVKKDIKAMVKIQRELKKELKATYEKEWFDRMLCEEYNKDLVSDTVIAYLFVDEL